MCGRFEYAGVILIQLKKCMHTNYQHLKKLVSHVNSEHALCGERSVTFHGCDITLRLPINATSPPGFKPTRNYTGPDEKYIWDGIARSLKEWKGYFTNNHPDINKKDLFRTRRHFWHPKGVPLRIQCQHSNEIGAFIKFTNSYCLLYCGEDSTNFLSTVIGDLPDTPVINTTLAGCQIVGRMCVGNNKGLLIPETVYDRELEQIKEQLPDSIKVETLEERLSALGNVVACNDKVALVHPDIDKKSEETIADTLQVEVFRTMLANNPLVGSYCVLNNKGKLIQPEISDVELENLSSLLQIPLTSGTVNCGSKVVAAGLVTNDWFAYAGRKTTAHEFDIIEKILQLKN